MESPPPKRSSGSCSLEQKLDQGLVSRTSKSSTHLLGVFRTHVVVVLGFLQV